MSAAPDQPVIAFASAADWKRWLDENHTESNGIWMRIFKKASATPTVTYAQALDAALCYGWIDGQKKKYDEESWIQKFTPRRARSTWSKTNTRHIERLTAAGKMKPAGRAQVESAKRDGRWERAYASPGTAVVPEDFMRELSKNLKAKAFFETLNKRNTFPIAYRLQSAGRPETRQRRLKEILAMLERGEKFYP